MADITKTKWNSIGKVVDAVAAAPHDTEKREFDAIFVGNKDTDPESVGNFTLRARDSAADVTFYNVLAGEFVPISTSFIRDTGTTCTNIVGLTVEEER